MITDTSELRNANVSVNKRENVCLGSRERRREKERERHSAYTGESLATLDLEGLFVLFSPLMASGSSLISSF